MAIGFVRALSGTTTAKNEKGEVRVLRIGDPVQANEVIQAGAGSTVHIVFNNGNFATVGSGDSLHWTRRSLTRQLKSCKPIHKVSQTFRR